MLVLLSIGSASATAPLSHADLDAATWSPVAQASHAVAGPIEISRTRAANVDCFRGEATVSGVTPEGLLQIVIDIASAPTWSSAGVSDGRVLKRAGDHLEYFQYLDVPGWTFASDRYWFLQGDIDRTGSGIAFRWNRLPDDAHGAVRRQLEQDHPRAVEPPVNLGGWFFEPRGDDVGVRYVICSDTGGSMPRMLQNAATRQTLPDTIGDLVREGRRRRP